MLQDSHNFKTREFLWAKELLLFRMMLGLQFRFAAVKLNLCFGLFVVIDGNNVSSSNVACYLFPCKKNREP